MDITRSNFKDSLPDIENAIRNCDFISFDTEFTGLSLPGDEICSLFDTPAERYAKQRRAVQAFTLMQIGIGCFRKNPELNKYEATVFNIYVFPSSIGKYNQAFTTQPSSFEFLCRNRFDFNKFAHEGVPFLNRRQVQSLHSDLETGQIAGQSDMDLGFFADTCQLLTEWLSKADPGQTTELDVEQLGSGPQRWIFEYELLRTFSQIRVKDSNSAKMTIERSPTGETADARSRERQTLLKKISEEFTGFSVVFDMMITAKKPLIGQNVLLDVMFCYEKFYDVLPDNYEQFKAQLRSLLPQIYDTKQLATGMRKVLEQRGCKSFGLGGLFKFLETEKISNQVDQFQPYVELTQNCKRYESEHCLHEAGFDAYAVGVVFIRLAHSQAMASLPSPTSEPLSYSKHIEAVKSLCNRINLINASVSYMNLNGPDPISLRPDWLVVSSKRRFRRLDRVRLVADLARFGSFDLRPLSASKVLLAVGGHGTAQAMMETSKTSDYYSIQKYNLYSRTRGTKVITAAAIVTVGILACAWTWNSFKTGRLNKS